MLVVHKVHGFVINKITRVGTVSKGSEQAKSDIIFYIQFYQIIISNSTQYRNSFFVNNIYSRIFRRYIDLSVWYAVIPLFKTNAKTHIHHKSIVGFKWIINGRVLRVVAGKEFTLVIYP